MIGGEGADGQHGGKREPGLGSCEATICFVLGRKEISSILSGVIDPPAYFPVCFQLDPLFDTKTGERNEWMDGYRPYPHRSPLSSVVSPPPSPDQRSGIELG